MQKHEFGTLPHLAFNVWMARTLVWNVWMVRIPIWISMTKWNTPIVIYKATHHTRYDWNKAGTGKRRAAIASPDSIGDVGTRSLQVLQVHAMATCPTSIRATVILTAVMATTTVVATTTHRAAPSAPTGDVGHTSPTSSVLLANGEATLPPAATCLPLHSSWTATNSNFRNRRGQQSRRLGLPAGRIKSGNLRACPGR